ncbi:EscC/YscC/HrcC family type III secretion system outer membrane ring protein [Paraburkholderia sp. NMBU_R16]|uniref:type III secretion system outer membrane ring subunit SctC n=1 Tax=Paraburkholderia sp. NMBU_R16 TaxID=2698676 RepID=UPI001567B77F|nr:type III secretion system outer membrane ring subunit SctC [Paraburkholderia sp. NMBU_R16]NRO98859.1 EscC/YscC/HrcC family type III secretion system outer membrane ring protein [Paraburkholderia sp. NMBU_R16]
MKWSRKLCAASLGVTLAIAPGIMPAYASPVHWRTPIVDYVAAGKDIKDVLRDLAASQGIPARISPDISGSVSGKFHLPPQNLLDTLAASFGFVWYYDGNLLDIVPSSEFKTTLVKLNTASTASLRETLDRIGVTDKRFPIVYDDIEGTALVSGPPRYVDLVNDIANRLDANASRRGGTEVRVFPLDHAWAEDRKVKIDGQDVTVEGVASVLNEVFHPKSGGSGGGSVEVSGRPSGVTRASPMGDVNGSQNNGPYSNSTVSPYVPPPLPPNTTGKDMFGGITGTPSPGLLRAVGEPQARQSNAGSAPSRDDNLPVIVADQRTNSVVIRDTTDRMSQYDTLVHRLDVKPQLIEIEAHIVEIDDDALQQLGIDWTAHNSHVDVQTGTGTLAQNTFNGTLTQNFGSTTLPGNTPALATPAGASVAAVLGDAGRYLMARISALQQSNAAKIDASPKVVTLNNVEAVMDNKTQFFVPVSGYTSGDLFSISAGISLRVLPMVVTEDGQTQIKLDVAIEDGQLTSQVVSNLPVIQNSTITTQAFINEGQALLIAGYRADNSSNGVTGVPGLSKIPFIGALFRTKTKQDNRMERLFVLAPRVITP